jgi:hypothetical protein
MRRLVKLAVASVAVTLTIAYVFGAAAVIVSRSPSGAAEPEACRGPARPTVTDL